MPRPPSFRLLSPLTISIALILTLASLFFIQRMTHSSGGYWGTKFDSPDPAEPIQLTDHLGQPFDLRQLQGKVVLLNFGFTHCPNICPTILNQLATLMAQLTPEERKRVQVVFVSIDPERDTPAVLRDYVPFFDEGFIGLSGEPAQIAEVAKRYHVYSKKAEDAATNPSYNVDHSTYTYLIDPLGRFAALYDDRKLAQPDKMADDIRKTLAETPTR